MPENPKILDGLDLHQLCHRNWLVAEEYVAAWRGMDRIKAVNREAVETHITNMERRASTVLAPQQKTQQTQEIADSQVLIQPTHHWKDTDGYHWGNFCTELDTTAGPIVHHIALDADSRESAIAAHQMLQLAAQDKALFLDLVNSKIHRIVARSSLSQLGYSQANTVFIRSAQSPAQMAIVLAHQVGHAVHGGAQSSDALATQYAEQYSQRNQSVFLAYQVASGQTLTSDQVLREGYEYAKEHLHPADFEAIKGYRISPTDRTHLATPADVATHIAFLVRQRLDQTRLWQQGIPITLPMSMPDCISHRSISVRPPITPTGLTSINPGTTRNPSQSQSGERPTDHPWIQDPTLPQHSTPRRYEEFQTRADIARYGQGGVVTYRGIKIIGLRHHCERGMRALDECWADDIARNVVWGHIHTIYMYEFLDLWGVSSAGMGIIGLRANAGLFGYDVLEAGSTIFHEGLHEQGYGIDAHPWIYAQENEFCDRRQRGPAATPATPATSVSLLPEEPVAADLPPRRSGYFLPYPPEAFQFPHLIERRA